MAGNRDNGRIARAGGSGGRWTTPGGRLVADFPPGSSTATPLNVAYRLGKVRKLGVLSGAWLDYGCADGCYTNALVEAGASRAVGIDVIEERIEAARRQFGDRPARQFLHAPTGALPFPDGCFDGVLVNEVLEHVADEALTLREIHRVLRPGGHVVIMSPNRWFPFEGHGARFGRLALPFPVPLLPWLPSGIGQRFMHARNYWPYELRRLVEAQGFKTAALEFVWPVLEVYRWLPARLIAGYQRLIPTLERLPVVGRFGVSVLVAGRKP